MSATPIATPLMRPLSDQPKAGQTVRVFLKDGTELRASCCMINEGKNRYLQWYDHITSEAIDINQIKGWMPAIDRSSSAEKLEERFGVTSDALRATIKPLALLMYDHGITTIKIERSGTKAMITVDGKPI